MPVRAKYKGSLDGSAPIYREFPVANSQTIYSGEIVALSSGKAVIATDAQATGTVLGMSASSIATSSAASASDTILVDINPNSVYRMNYIGNATPVQGTKYDLGAAAHQFDADDTTGGYIQVVGYVDTTNKFADVILTNRVYAV